MYRRSLNALLFLFAVLLKVGCGGEDPTSSDAAVADASIDGLVEGDSAVDATCILPQIPTEGPAFSLTAAGAPPALFGPPNAPTFREAYTSLRAAGFTRHFPFFGTREIVDRPAGDMTPSESSGHEAFFFDGSCDGGSAFTAAQETGMEILFPAFFFFPDGEWRSYDDAAVRTSFESYRSACFREAESVITGFYTFDEVSSNWAGTELGNRAFGTTEPLPSIENAVSLAATVRELTDVPIYAVDGPARPLLERDRVAIEGAGVDLDTLLSDYDSQLRTFASSADVFGFDAYPIPEDYWFPLATSGNLVRTAAEVTPNGTPIMAVLQGMSFDAQGGHTGIGATGRPPTFTESRFMAYDAIVAGAEELVWYGPNFLDLERMEDAAFWNDLQRLVGEIQSLAPALAGDRRTIALENEDVAAVAFDVSDSELVIVVNRTDGMASTSIPLEDGTALVRHPSGEREASTTLTLTPYEVALFLTTRCPQ